MKFKLSDFDYPLPQEKIALFPQEKRSESKLLVYQNEHIGDSKFAEIGNYIPENSLIVCNNSKVIPARLIFHKPSGAKIEVFITRILKVETEKAMVEALIGNLSKWKDLETLSLQKEEYSLSAKLIDRDKKIVECLWQDSTLSFFDLLEKLGKIPLPPYIHREVQSKDRERYQTVFAQQEGSVAAPTAGLHFEKPLMLELQKKGIQFDYLTLHVSAGTFLPIKTENVEEHIIHSERISIPKALLLNLQKKQNIIAVGTTAMRTLESIYWFAHLVKQGKTQLSIPQYVWHTPEDMSRQEAISILLQYLKDTQQESIEGDTSLFILPDYKVRMLDALLTNFHQPKSSLLLLVSALTGDKWKNIYQHALQNNYRFLSYGDASFILFK